MAEHQNLGTILRKEYTRTQRGYEQSNVHQDYSGIHWTHYPAAISDLTPVPGKTKTVTDDVDTSKGGAVEADEQLKIAFNMDHSFVIEKEAYTTSVTMDIPYAVRQDIAGVPEQVVFPHIGEHIINMKNTCPLPSHLASQGESGLRLRFEQKVYTATIRVQTDFTGVAVFGRTRVNVKNAISSMSGRSEQCLANGDFVSIGKCKIITRKYRGVDE